MPDARDRKKPGQVGDFTGKAQGTVAVACPFCMTMLKDAINETGREEGMKVKDVSELIAEAMEPSDSSSASTGVGGATPTALAEEEK
jgi:hypothetical protein